MINSVIVYLPGSGGNFLRRALSLSQNSIVEFAEIRLGVQEKFYMFNDWSPDNWKHKEKLHRPAYRTGQQHFVDFEKSDLYLIDAWHPVEFLNHDNSEMCWSSQAWPKLVFLHVKNQQRNFLEKNQKNKQYSLNWDQEQSCFLQLREKYADREIDIDFEFLLDQTLFESTIQTLDYQLQLNLDLKSAVQLWRHWHNQSMITWQR